MSDSELPQQAWFLPYFTAKIMKRFIPCHRPLRRWRVVAVNPWDCVVVRMVLSQWLQSSVNQALVDLMKTLSSAGLSPPMRSGSYEISLFLYLINYL
jgi:hypothetical protein